MSAAAAEIKQRIFRTWQDRRVAAWVIDQLPLLHLPQHEEVPIYDLRLTYGLTQINTSPFPLGEFRYKLKYGMSGGFQGTDAHLISVSQMHAIRQLETEPGRAAVVVLLEQDKYIEDKGWPTLVPLDAKSVLWARSGLVDSVVRLPRRRKNALPSIHYECVSHHLLPLEWVSHPENPAAHEIVTRDHDWEFSPRHLTHHPPRLHTSLLTRTQHMTVKEVRKAAFASLLSMAQQPELYDTPPKSVMTPMEYARVLFREIGRGLC